VDKVVVITISGTMLNFDFAEEILNEATKEELIEYILENIPKKKLKELVK